MFAGTDADRSQASVKQAMDQMNLLSGVRNDIEYAHAQLFL
jgi:hypothetical protein